MEKDASLANNVCKRLTAIIGYRGRFLTVHASRPEHNHVMESHALDRLNVSIKATMLCTCTVADVSLTRWPTSTSEKSGKTTTK
jgi:hypothetical protein